MFWMEPFLESPGIKDFWVLENPGIWSLQVLEKSIWISVQTLISVCSCTKWPSIMWGILHDIICSCLATTDSVSVQMFLLTSLSVTYCMLLQQTTGDLFILIYVYLLQKSGNLIRSVDWSPRLLHHSSSLNHTDSMNVQGVTKIIPLQKSILGNFLQLFSSAVCVSLTGYRDLITLIARTGHSW